MGIIPAYHQEYSDEGELIDNIKEMIACPLIILTPEAGFNGGHPTLDMDIEPSIFDVMRHAWLSDLTPYLSMAKPFGG